MVFDRRKAATSKVMDVVKQILLMAIDDVRVVWRDKGIGLYFFKGKVYECKILKPEKGDYESLTFSAELDSPIGRYQMVDRPDP